MRLQYTEAIVLAPDDGEPVAMLRPEIPVRVITREGRSGLYTGLLDTGADHIVFPLSVADELQIDPRIATGPGSQTASGERLTLSFADVELAIECDDVTLQWTTRVFFNQSPARSDILLLGQMGFLEYFTVVFFGGELAFEIEPNEFLPRVSNESAP